MTYFRNAWYLAAFADELVTGRMLARTLLGEPLVFFRRQAGSVASLFDRCPHRFAPLSAGKLCDGGASVECGYHGLRFDAQGACLHNPHGKGSIPKAARVRSYVAREVNRMIWWWAGEPDAADASLIPDCSEVIEAPRDVTVRGYLPTACHYHLLVDSILDLAHADYLRRTR